MSIISSPLRMAQTHIQKALKSNPNDNQCMQIEIQILKKNMKKGYKNYIVNMNVERVVMLGHLVGELENMEPKQCIAIINR